MFKLVSQVGKRKGRPSFEGGSRAGSCTPFSRRHARVRSGLEDTRPSCVCVCVCGCTCARMCSSPAAPLGQGRPYRDRAPSKQVRENGGRTQIGPHISVLGLRSAWSPRRRPSESSMLGDPGRHPRGDFASPGKRSPEAIVVGDIASVTSAVGASVGAFTTEGAGPGAAPVGAFRGQVTPQGLPACCPEGRPLSWRLRARRAPGAPCRARGPLNPPHGCHLGGPNPRPRPAR